MARSITVKHTMGKSSSAVNVITAGIGTSGLWNETEDLMIAGYQ